MTNYEELVEALRGKFIAYDVTGNHNSAQLYKDAADEIEALVKINNRFRELLDNRNKDVTELQRNVDELTSQLPKRGKWIVKGANRIDCSVCGHSICFAFGLSEGSLTGYNYCPNCGAKMEVQE